MMHTSMMRQFCHGRTDGRTNGDPDMRAYDACTNLDSDAYIHYACMYYAYTYAPSYVHDAYICGDAYIIQSLTMLHVFMMRLKFCDQPTNEQGDSTLEVGWKSTMILSKL